MITAERIDPLLVAPTAPYDRESLRLHLERYQFAQQYVRDRHVVDCACGTGYGAELLASSGARSVLGVDISEEAIAFARQHHAHRSLEYRVDDAMEFQPARRPEVWVTLETVEHLPDPSGYLRTVHRRMAPGGILIASVPTTVSTDGNPYHLTDFSRKSWCHLLTRSGFRIADTLCQVHRFGLSEIRGGARGERRQLPQLLKYYLRKPQVAWARLALTVTRGWMHEYLVVAAERTER
jgi:SAM-dependent methyltransferase